MLLYGAIILKAALADKHYKRFEAYDCTQPHNVRDVGYAEYQACGVGSAIQTTRNVTYQVLQKEKRLQYQGYRCSIEKDRNAYFCGAYHHQTKLTDEASYSKLPITVPREDCRRYVRDRLYLDTKGVEHKISLNAKNIIKYHEAGTSFFSLGDTVTPTQIACQGQDWVRGNDIMANMVIEVQITLIITKEKFLGNGDEMIAYTKEKIIPCPTLDRACETPTATYIWDPPMDSCPMARARITTGVLSYTDNRQVYTSTDGSLLRLVLKDTVSYCGEIVTETNLEDIYLFESDGLKNPFPRTVRAEELQIVTYVNARDDYLYHHIREQLPREVGSVLNQECERLKAKTKEEFWFQHRSPGYMTWMISNGTFATTAGEVIYVYDCERVLVEGLDLDRCYEGLPVRRLQNSTYSDPNPDAPLFLTPLTNRLTRKGIPTKCTRPFLPKFRNVLGGWVSATPELHHTTAPTPGAAAITTKPIGLDYVDFTKGGVYTQEELTNFQDLQDFDRAQLDLNARLTEGAKLDDLRVGGGINPNELFPHVQELNFLDKAYHEAIQAFMWWGTVSSGVIGIILIIQIVVKVAMFLYSLVTLRTKRKQEWKRALCWSLCPDFLIMKQPKQRRTTEDLLQQLSELKVQMSELQELNTEGSGSGDLGYRSGRVTPYPKEVLDTAV